ncbi:MAG: lantibiotic dehydratase [Pseudonocardia sp.]
MEPDDRHDLAAGLTGLPGSNPDTVCAQVSFPPLEPATAHVARAVRSLPALVGLADHPDNTADSGVLTPQDLAMGCDNHRPDRGGSPACECCTDGRQFRTRVRTPYDLSIIRSS